MLNKSSLLISLCLMLTLTLGAQQEKELLELSISDTKIIDDSIIVTLSINNHCTNGIYIYKPLEADINYGVLKLFIKNVDSCKRHEIIPIGSEGDLAGIIITSRNSIFLNRNEGFTKTFQFGLNEISPYLEKGDYLIYAMYLLEDIHLETDLEIFRGNLSSNKCILKFKVN